MFKGLMLSVALATTVMFGAAATAQATVYDFTGVCSDCTGSVSAQLTLTDYTPGDTIMDANFVSFTYDGSDLLPAFTIAAADQPYAYGDLQTLPGPDDFTLIGDGEFFFTSAGGDWCAGPICGGDTGDTHTWSVSAAPEPSSWALMIVGVGVFRVTLRSRARQVAE